MARTTLPTDRVRARAPAMPPRPGWSPTAVRGAVAGALAGTAMAAWTMFAGATYVNTGLLTLLYLVASPFSGEDPAAASLTNASGGDMVTWSTGAVVVGVVVHVLVSMGLGAFFGLLARGGRLTRSGSILAGTIFGLVVMALMDWIVQPATDAVFGGGRYVSDIGSLLGWGTWTLAHLVFGAVLGLWVALRPGDVGASDDGEPVR